MLSLQGLIYKKNTSLLFRISLHAAFWCVYWAINYYFNTISFNPFGSTPLAWLDPLFSVLNLIVFYYPFMYFVVPLIFKLKKYLFGILLLCVQIVLFTILYEVQGRQLISHCSSCLDILARIPNDFKIEQSLSAGIISSLLSFGIVYIIIAKLSPVIAIKIALDFVRERTAATELEKENLLLEFNFLKSQVNPHFMFNTLNNIYSLIIQERKQQAAGTVAKLSDLLRHSLYESGKESIPLSKEIKLLEDYIELEKLRLNKTRVTVQISSDKQAVHLPPLLFIPLVENAFKYAADNLPVDSFIDISIELKDKNLQFNIRNNYDPMKRNTTGGIGLQNLRKRLQHYYPAKHTLSVSDKEDIYEIKICIEI